MCDKLPPRAGGFQFGPLVTTETPQLVFDCSIRATASTLEWHLTQAFGWGMLGLAIGQNTPRLSTLDKTGFAHSPPQCRHLISVHLRRSGKEKTNRGKVLCCARAASDQAAAPPRSAFFGNINSSWERPCFRPASNRCGSLAWLLLQMCGPPPPPPVT